MTPTSDAAALQAFAARVRGLRKARGLSQGEFAEHAGMHRTYISSVERGRRNVALVNVLRLASALDIDPGVLLEGLSVPSSEAPTRR